MRIRKRFPFKMAKSRNETPVVVVPISLDDIDNVTEWEINHPLNLETIPEGNENEVRIVVTPPDTYAESEQI